LLLDDNDKSNKGMNLLGLDEILPTTLWMWLKQWSYKNHPGVVGCMESKWMTHKNNL
jgi:hypothetical protein